MKSVQLPGFERSGSVPSFGLTPRCGDRHPPVTAVGNKTHWIELGMTELNSHVQNVESSKTIDERQCQLWICKPLLGLLWGYHFQIKLSLFDPFGGSPLINHPGVSNQGLMLASLAEIQDTSKSSRSAFPRDAHCSISLAASTLVHGMRRWEIWTGFRKGKVWEATSVISYDLSLDFIRSIRSI